ncbi:MAG: hypothetical protein R2849_22270 [Thermomicrobiales bacterium]
MEEIFGEHETDIQSTWLHPPEAIEVLGAVGGSAVFSALEAWNLSTASGQKPRRRSTAAVRAKKSLSSEQDRRD